jgi:ribulose-bisphosphate carboxylase large chain
VHGRPLIGTIIKPNVGLSAEETGELVGKLCAAGVDFIKDDECPAIRTMRRWSSASRR